MEAILKEERQYNVDHEILPSVNIVIDRLLGRTLEMRQVYDELDEKLTPSQQELFAKFLLPVAAFWTPERAKELRDTQRELHALNIEIAKSANKLADLIGRRRNLCEEHSISAYDDTHVVDWIERAAEQHSMFNLYVKDKLHLLSVQFDLKYWPETDKVVRAIASYAENSEIYTTDSWSETLIDSSKSSIADILRVLLEAIEDGKDYCPYPLPKEFRLSDNSLATLINCSLDLDCDAIVDADYVKRTRQRIREKKKAFGKTQATIRD